MSARSDELISQGWEKKHTAFGARLKESVELFEELGYEVLLEEAEAPDYERDNLPDPSCQNCVHQFEKTIFIRKRE